VFQYGGVAVLVVLAVVFGGQILREYLGFSGVEDAPGFISDTEDFRASLAGHEPNADGASLLLDRVDKVVAEYAVSSAGLDSRANTILGFLGAGVGVLSAFAGTTGNTAFVPTPLLVFGGTCILFSLAFAVSALWVRTDATPNLEAYCDAAFLSAANSEAVLAARLAQWYLVLQADAIKPLFQKGAAVRATQLFFALGAASLTLNLVSPKAHDKPAKSKLTCLVQQHQTRISCDKETE
jgi:hypothetical protein